MWDVGRVDAQPKNYTFPPLEGRQWKVNELTDIMTKRLTLLQTTKEASYSFTDIRIENNTKKKYAHHIREAAKKCSYWPSLK